MKNKNPVIIPNPVIRKALFLGYHTGSLKSSHPNETINAMYNTTFMLLVYSLIYDQYNI